jgi:hypothetical protein
VASPALDDENYLCQLAAFIVTALVLSLSMIRFRIVPKRRLWGARTPKRCINFWPDASTSPSTELGS